MTGRPSLAGDRVDRILDAFGRCLVRRGLEGTTLEHVAAEAGMARGHVRHYVGNRDRLRELFRHRLVERYTGTAEALAAARPPGGRSAALVRHLFAPGPAPLDDYAAVDALVAAARFDEAVRGEMRGLYAGLERLLADCLAADHPGRPGRVYRDAAYQVLSLLYGHSTMAQLGFPAARRAPALRAALALVDGARL